MAKGFLSRVHALWELSEQIEQESTASLLDRFKKPRAEFLEPNLVKEILERKQNPTIDDVLIHE